MVNLILILDIRAKRVADTKINRLRKATHNCGSFFYLEEQMIQKSRYRIPNQKEFRRLEQSVNLIYQAADYFQEYFVGRKMVYSTQKMK